MSLTDPREALAEQSSFVGYLLGVAGLGRAVRALAADGTGRPGTPGEPDAFVHLLLGLASVGDAVERLAGTSAPPETDGSETNCALTRWLR